MTLKLPAEVDLGYAETLKQELIEAMTGDGPLEIKADKVERITTSGIQLLIAAAAGKQGAVKFVKPSDAFKQGFNDLGLQPWLEKQGGGA